MLTIVWFRRDLRLRDNPALAEAAAAGAVLPVYVHDPEGEGPGGGGGASRWWLHHSLEALRACLEEAGLKLVLRRGPAAKVLADLGRESGAQALAWNRLYEPATMARDQKIKESLQAQGLQIRSHSAALLREPWELKTGGGGPYQVFTPFYKALLALGPGRSALPRPRRLEGPAKPPRSERLEDWGLLPSIPWDREFPEHWTPGEAGALARLKAFLERGVAGYAEQRDQPALELGTSLLSAPLHFGELSPLQIWEAAQGRVGKGPQSFLRELAWREFSHHLLYHFPATVEQPLRPAFAHFPWARGAAARNALQAWKRGLTGFPLADAGLRQLWRTGGMHNRVRMVAASVLVKDFLVDWREGAAHFADALVDFDLAQNTLGWQWTAGCGADAAPYFRIFHPSLQGERFDPQGAYVRRWVPELKGLPDRWIHRPWEAPAEVLEAAGLKLGRDYPRPLIDHAEARQRALELFQGLPRETPAAPKKASKSRS